MADTTRANSALAALLESSPQLSDHEINTEGLLPWKECPPERLSRQQSQVRRLGYCPTCENWDITALNRRGWPSPSLSLLRESAGSKCGTCQFILDLITDFGLVRDLQAIVDQTSWTLISKWICDKYGEDRGTELLNHGGRDMPALVAGLFRINFATRTTSWMKPLNGLSDVHFSLDCPEHCTLEIQVYKSLGTFDPFCEIHILIKVKRVATPGPQFPHAITSRQDPMTPYVRSS